MALKITATLIVRKGDAQNTLITTDDLDTTAYEVANWLKTNLPTTIPTTDVSVVIEDVKRDGTIKTGNTGTYQADNTDDNAWTPGV
jgi:hypothetical protein